MSIHPFITAPIFYQLKETNMGSSLYSLPSISSRKPSLQRSSKSPFCCCLNARAMAKELYFNHDGSTMKKLQAGADLVARLVGVTLGPKGRNVVLQNKYGPPKIVNDGETVLKQIELEDPVENVGVKLVRLAGAKTNELAGDGCTTSIVLSHGIIAEGMKVIAAGRNPIQLARGIEKTTKALVSELKLMSKEVQDHEIAKVASVSAGNDDAVGSMIADAIQNVGRTGVVRIEKGNLVENCLQIVEGMQFDRGYLSPYLVTDRRNRIAELHNCKLLLVDKKISNPNELFKILDNAVKEDYPVLIIAEGVEPEALAPVIRNKLKGVLRAVAVRAPGVSERKSHYLDDIAILTGGIVIRDENGLTLENAHKGLLGTASKVVVTKDSTLIVTDARTREAVEKRIFQIKMLLQNTEENFEKKILNERIARLSGGIAVIQVGAQTVVEMKDKQLRVEDAVNATKAAIEEGVVVGGGCCLLRLSSKIEIIKESLDNEEQKIGADILKRALAYPARQIAKNAGQNGNSIIEKVMSVDDVSYGFNAAKNQYEDLMAAGVLDPTKVHMHYAVVTDATAFPNNLRVLHKTPNFQVIRCCLEHASSVARTFLTCNAVVVDVMEPMPLPRKPMQTSGIGPVGDQFANMSNILR